MSCLFHMLCVVYGVLSIRSSLAAITATNSSFPRTSYTFYLDSGLPSTWYNNNSVIMDGWKMRVFLLIQGSSRNVGFYCGFYSEETSDLFSFSIVAIGGGSQKGHDVVWSTKWDYGVRENASLQLIEDEGLVLRDSDGNRVWSADNKSGKPVVGMNLTEAGNLVLFGNEGAVIWQSFDHPLDTLLIGQRLYEDQKLVANPSRRNSPFFATLPSAARFSAFFNTSDGQTLMYYQLALDRNSRNRSGLQYDEAGKRGFVVNLGKSEASKPLDYILFLKLGTDGRLRTHWYGSESVEDNKDMVTQECEASPKGYLLKEVRDINYSNSNNADSATVSIRTVNDCKMACLQSCSCIAVVFRYENDVSDGKCYMPSEIYSVNSNNNNNITDQGKLQAFIKVLNPDGASTSLPEVPPSSWVVRHQKALAAILSAGGFSIILITVLCIVMLKKKRKEADGDGYLKQVPGMPLRFSYEELEIATENFKETLGCGGFGSVYKGVLADGTRIAVKRLNKMSQGMREFLAEVETIGSLHHFNLVRLVGFCEEKSCRLVVYEHLINGSLDIWIFNRDKAHYLDWKTRKKIIRDIAKGLAYLHEECRQKIIHLDIKPHNILLDENFNAKVSDFGLSTLIDRDESQVLTTLRGTPGYLAPEWKELRVTVKVDVYSFGIVLLEIVCKRRNVESSRSDSSFHLLKLLQKKAEDDQLIDIVEDLDEDMENNREEVERMIRIGAWCLQNDYNRRPFMSTVVKVLEGVMEVDPNISYEFSHALQASTAVVADDHITVAPQDSILSGAR
ncbi:G-type lectin S-receptor-like serine/threonine-protein kinase SD2-5 [Morus notabilis]|uniref:Receptor-like serine/threonine-protein kinase n=1 Tax=Morus notabilis TaxID=981085 RepID=W9S6F9_9ROSA|nr:G-type lectin S-receptor-like serine/threonine-protein kinase SD2-5 [Morus notabilis]EXB92375.1 G-type lectin S-receptor-like serine/threonine-protein kinase SD2-5 [Morus notabilis]